MLASYGRAANSEEEEDAYNFDLGAGRASRSVKAKPSSKVGKNNTSTPRKTDTAWSDWSGGHSPAVSTPTTRHNVYSPAASDSGSALEKAMGLINKYKGKPVAARAGGGGGGGSRGKRSGRLGVGDDDEVDVSLSSDDTDVSSPPRRKRDTGRLTAKSYLGGGGGGGDGGGGGGSGGSPGAVLNRSYAAAQSRAAFPTARDLGIDTSTYEYGTASGGSEGGLASPQMAESPVAALGGAAAATGSMGMTGESSQHTAESPVAALGGAAATAGSMGMTVKRRLSTSQTGVIRSHSDLAHETVRANARHGSRLVRAPSVGSDESTARADARHRSRLGRAPSAGSDDSVGGDSPLSSGGSAQGFDGNTRLQFHREASHSSDQSDASDDSGGGGGGGRPKLASFSDLFAVTGQAVTAVTASAAALSASELEASTWKEGESIHEGTRPPSRGSEVPSEVSPSHAAAAEDDDSRETPDYAEVAQQLLAGAARCRMPSFPSAAADSDAAEGASRGSGGGGGGGSSGGSGADSEEDDRYSEDFDEHIGGGGGSFRCGGGGGAGGASFLDGSSRAAAAAASAAAAVDRSYSFSFEHDQSYAAVAEGEEGGSAFRALTRQHSLVAAAPPEDALTRALQSARRRSSLENADLRSKTGTAAAAAAAAARSSDADRIADGVSAPVSTHDPGRAAVTSVTLAASALGDDAHEGGHAGARRGAERAAAAAAAAVADATAARAAPSAPLTSAAAAAAAAPPASAAAAAAAVAGAARGALPPAFAAPHASAVLAVGAAEVTRGGVVVDRSQQAADEEPSGQVAAPEYAYDAERGATLRSCGTQFHGNTAAVQADSHGNTAAVHADVSVYGVRGTESALDARLGLGGVGYQPGGPYATGRFHYDLSAATRDLSAPAQGHLALPPPPLLPRPPWEEQQPWQQQQQQWQQPQPQQQQWQQQQWQQQQQQPQQWQRQQQQHQQQQQQHQQHAPDSHSAWLSCPAPALLTLSGGGAGGTLSVAEAYIKLLAQAQAEALAAQRRLHEALLRQTSTSSSTATPPPPPPLDPAGVPPAPPAAAAAATDSAAVAEDAPDATASSAQAAELCQGAGEGGRAQGSGAAMEGLASGFDSQEAFRRQLEGMRASLQSLRLRHELDPMRVKQGGPIRDILRQQSLRHEAAGRGVGSYAYATAGAAALHAQQWRPRVMTTEEALRRCDLGLG
ncbi:hypothetical protein JKP88DRAFT_287334 [Tribonema minus]|uniref:Uncharacterized protein n=1 Tax=Tribonema minus TaxID=303371 RepID=A0A836CKG0_9STRA|nr:hypothetical protein JKP88DRAFT_287334 [Tribonema minus]